MWLAYAEVNEEFVEKSSYLGYFKVVLGSQNNGMVKESVEASASAVAVATGSYTIAFLVGGWFAEGFTLPTAQETIKGFLVSESTASSAGKFNGKPNVDDGSLREPLLGNDCCA